MSRVSDLSQKIAHLRAAKKHEGRDFTQKDQELLHNLQTVYDLLPSNAKDQKAALDNMDKFFQGVKQVVALKKAVAEGLSGTALQAKQHDDSSKGAGKAHAAFQHVQDALKSMSDDPIQQIAYVQQFGKFVAGIKAAQKAKAAQQQDTFEPGPRVRRY